jgi:hypothetical protein
LYIGTAFRTPDKEEGLEPFYIGANIMSVGRFTKEVDNHGFSRMIRLSLWRNLRGISPAARDELLVI